MKHTGQKMSHVRPSIQLGTHTVRLRCSPNGKKRKHSRHLTLVYMRHVTFMLIVESENINSIRALCFWWLFSTLKNLHPRIRMLHPRNICIQIRCHMKITNGGTFGMTWKTSRNEFGAWQPQSCNSLSIASKWALNINKPKRLASDTVDGFVFFII